MLTLLDYADAVACARGARQMAAVAGLCSAEGLPTRIPAAMGLSKAEQASADACATARRSWDVLVRRLERAGFAVVAVPVGRRGGRRLVLERPRSPWVKP